MDIFELVKLIEKRPGMYIESQSSTELDYFLRGFMAASQINDNDSTATDIYYEFNKWVCGKLSISANVSWRRAVAFQEPNEYFAFKTFFELWNEWLDKRQTL
ncbi:hypothetical protein [Hahella sp. HN01]|uniref:hypothetical protein n=1 Tax=unclassified Hahella TaxID=2624107 RepID=UPI001C1EE82B|nr:hypothetical protein [Hahella sp. HN01]MBU6955974.1 hypothetical protein [Hahella sp. HN01]